LPLERGRKKVPSLRRERGGVESLFRRAGLKNAFVFNIEGKEIISFEKKK